MTIGGLCQIKNGDLGTATSRISVILLVNHLRFGTREANSISSLLRLPVDRLWSTIHQRGVGQVALCVSLKIPALLSVG
jgi:hypothetical protein